MNTTHADFLHVINQYQTNVHEYQLNLRLCLESIRAFSWPLMDTSGSRVQEPSLHEVGRRMDDLAHRLNQNMRSYHSTMETALGMLSSRHRRNVSDSVVTFTIYPTTTTSTTTTTEEETPPAASVTNMASNTTVRSIYAPPAEGAEAGTDVSGSEVGGLVCPITLERILPGEDITTITACGHVFRSLPLENWLRRNSACPVCRRRLPSLQDDPTTAIDRLLQSVLRGAATPTTLESSLPSVEGTFAETLIQTLFENVSASHQG